MRNWLQSIATIAVLVSAATLISRVFGLFRWVIFSPTVGAGEVGNAYQTANIIPNVLYEVVAGGALAGAVVPLLAVPLSRGDKAAVSKIGSALLTWALTITIPVALALVAFRSEISETISNGGAKQQFYTSEFLMIFAAQIPLYAVGGVLTGILQAHRKFLWPAFVPAVSSTIVAGSYFLYSQLRSQGLAADAPELLILLGGFTTIGVASMTLPLFLPVAQIGTKLRFRWSFPGGLALKAAKLSGSGISVLVAQQMAVIAVMIVSNRYGPTGSFVVFGYTQAIYLLPYAILIVPVSTVAFTKVSQLVAESADNLSSYISNISTRIVVLGFVAAGSLSAASYLLKLFFVSFDAEGASSSSAFESMSFAVVVMSFSLPGWGLMTWGARVMYSLDRSALATYCSFVGWFGVLLGLIFGSVFALGRTPVPVLQVIGFSYLTGMTLGGISAVIAIRRLVGSAAVKGVVTGSVVGIFSAVCGALAGKNVSNWFYHLGSSGQRESIVLIIGSGFLGGVVSLVIVVAVIAVFEHLTGHRLIRPGRGSGPV